MAKYTDTLVQMYHIVWDQEKKQTSSGDASARYVETAKKVIKLERELTKASNKIVSPTLFHKIRAVPKGAAYRYLFSCFWVTSTYPTVVAEVEIDSAKFLVYRYCNFARNLVISIPN